MAEDISAFLVRRDGDGNIMPYEVEVLGIRDKPMLIEILPTTLGSLKGLSTADDEALKWPVEDKLRYVREHVVKPDFGAMSAEELMDMMTVWDLDMLLVTAIQNGGPMRQREGVFDKKNPTGRRSGGRSQRRSPRSKRTSTS